MNVDYFLLKNDIKLFQRTARVPLKQWEDVRGKDILKRDNPYDKRPLEQKMDDIIRGETVEDYFLNRNFGFKFIPNKLKYDNTQLHQYSWDIMDCNTYMRVEIKSYTQQTISFYHRNYQMFLPPAEGFTNSCLDLTHPLDGNADIIIFCSVDPSKEPGYLYITPTLIIDAEIDIVKDLAKPSTFSRGSYYIKPNSVEVYGKQFENSGVKLINN